MFYGGNTSFHLLVNHKPVVINRIASPLSCFCGEFGNNPALSSGQKYPHCPFFHNLKKSVVSNCLFLLALFGRLGNCLWH